MERVVEKNSSTSSFKFPAAFALALAVCLFLRFAELFLPPQFFTHRVWEALIVHEQFAQLPGPVYPMFKIEMEEVGDLVPHTGLAVKKKVRWETDRYGYRKADSALEDYPVVVVGDSTAMGTALDQGDLLSEVLEKKLGVPVYTYAPYYQLKTFLSDKRFKEHSPKTVVFVMMEWALPEILGEVTSPAPAKFKLPVPAAVLMDRWAKKSLMRGIEGRVRAFMKSWMKKPSYLAAADGKMIFSAGTGAHPDQQPETAEEIARALKKYSDELKLRGTRFVFLPVPNKETVYWQLIPGKPEPVFMKTLLQKLKEAGVEAVDFYAALADDYSKTGRFLYHADDTHWNPEGVRLAASLLEEKLK